MMVQTVPSREALTPYAVGYVLAPLRGCPDLWVKTRATPQVSWPPPQCLAEGHAHRWPTIDMVNMAFSQTDASGELFPGVLPQATVNMGSAQRFGQRPGYGNRFCNNHLRLENQLRRRAFIPFARGHPIAPFLTLDRSSKTGPMKRETASARFFLQNHGHEPRYRNIWRCRGGIRFLVGVSKKLVFFGMTC